MLTKNGQPLFGFSFPISNLLYNFLALNVKGDWSFPHHLFADLLQ